MKRSGDVRRLVEWAVATEKALAGPRDPALPLLASASGRSGCGCASVAQVAALGGFVDGPSFATRSLGNHVNPDAEAVAGWLCRRLHPVAFELVARHARSGTAPDHTPCKVLTVEPQRVYKGGRWRPYVRKLNQGRQIIEVCPVVYVDHSDRLAHAREVWQVWYAALRSLEAAVRGSELRLANWLLLPWDAAERPWQTNDKDVKAA